MLSFRKLFSFRFFRLLFNKQNYFLHYLVDQDLVICLDHHTDQALRSRRAHQNAGGTGIRASMAASASTTGGWFSTAR